jgi:hypothetical protein
MRLAASLTDQEPLLRRLHFNLNSIGSSTRP